MNNFEVHINKFIKFYIRFNLVFIQKYLLSLNNIIYVLLMLNELTKVTNYHLVFIDQIIVSLSNFLITILILRILGVQSFGYFGFYGFFYC